MLALGWLVAAARAEVRVDALPAVLRPGDVSLVRVEGVVSPRGTVAGRALEFYPSDTGFSALVPIDVETPPGRYEWTLSATGAAGEEPMASGALTVVPREFPVERLTLPNGMVDLDPPTRRRVETEAQTLRDLHVRVTNERLWRGRFVVPVATTRAPTGFGARRLINGQPRAPHSGLDYSAPRGTTVVAANRGRVALTAEFFFPGRLVIIDHGLGLYTAYFHLDRLLVAAPDLVDAGQPIGVVGATGRATGAHLHFAVTLGGARIDPAGLLSLNPPE